MGILDVVLLWLMGGTLGYMVRAARQVEQDARHDNEIRFLENYVATLQATNDDLGRRLKHLEHPAVTNELLDSWFPNEGE